SRIETSMSARRPNGQQCRSVWQQAVAGGGIVGHGAAGERRGRRTVIKWAEDQKMDLTCRFLGEDAILDLTGRLMVSAGEMEILPFRSVVQRLIAEGHVLLVLNVARLMSIDARGLGELVTTAATLRGRCGDLMLVTPSARLTKMLSVTRLADLIHSCDSESEAILHLRRIIERACRGGVVSDEGKLDAPVQNHAMLSTQAQG